MPYFQSTPMRGYVANTDYEWYLDLSSRNDLDEVNFWLPSDTRAFRAVEPGAPFFFKLKKPHYAICGYGFYARHSVLPAWLAWQSFGQANGASTFAEMKRRIEKYRRPEVTSPHGKYDIGCLMISSPVFFTAANWVRQPSDWKMNVVQGAGYSLTEGEGRRIWQECQAQAGRQKLPSYEEVAFGQERYGLETVTRPRLGQGTFRIAVLDAYGRACAISSEHSLPALEAAHIKPYQEGGAHDVRNGLLLRADIHRLFDLGYVTVTPDHHFEVSQRLKEDFFNGRSYYPFHGHEIQIPTDEEQGPNPDLLEWHNSEIYLG